MARISFTAPERGALLARAVKATVGPMREQGGTGDHAEAGDAMTLLDLADALLEGNGRDFDALLVGAWRPVALEAAGLAVADEPAGADEPDAGEA